ncbi:hypothetical protein UA08_09137 [Talaromyces atroroseus]|uniref:Transcription factor domain-containing protein n=1 Tax=Talaromyces atroroseus TaxID=1441469 RepID=A0A1Q5Q6X9_TALAT|nr:hypothetical protein UA08_09137 [Talaromyces atroroseus]OKL55599.1 hypothetical protein UA08_09137 [Talaromyces atroroseus]
MDVNRAACCKRSKECHYQASRRGGPRKGAKYDNSKRNTDIDASRLPQAPTNSVGYSGKMDTRMSISASDRKPVTAPGSQADPLNVSGLVSPSSGIQNFVNLSGILSVTDGVCRCWNQLYPDEGQPNHETAAPGNPTALTMRAYENEADILNAYYAFIHPYLPLLPPPVVPQYEDCPVIVRMQEENFTSPSRTVVPYWPVSPLSLALSSILVLIPPAQDVYSASKTALRRAYSEIYASSALESVNREVELLGLTSGCTRRPFHPNAQLELEAIQALVTLSTYEYCQRGNISKMRLRTNQAVTTAMDMSLHDLGKETIEIPEAQRRAWWMTMYMAYFSSVLNVSPPIISVDDPRITTPYPEFLVPLEPWPLILKAQRALFSSTNMLKGFEAGSRVLPASLSEENFHELNMYLQSLMVESDHPLPMMDRHDAEASAVEGLWIIARILIHT